MQNVLLENEKEIADAEVEALIHDKVAAPAKWLTADKSFFRDPEDEVKGDGNGKEKKAVHSFKPLRDLLMHNIEKQFNERKKHEKELWLNGNKNPVQEVREFYSDVKDKLARAFRDTKEEVCGVELPTLPKWPLDYYGRNAEVKQAARKQVIKSLMTVDDDEAAGEKKFKNLDRGVREQKMRAQIKIKWKTLTDSEQQVFIDMCDAEKAAYEQWFAERPHLMHLKKEIKKEESKSPKPPKFTRLSAFDMFRDDCIEQGLNLKTEDARIRFAELSNEEKDKFIKMASDHNSKDPKSDKKKKEPEVEEPEVEQPVEAPSSKPSAKKFKKAMKDFEHSSALLHHLQSEREVREKRAEELVPVITDAQKKMEQQIARSRACAEMMKAANEVSQARLEAGVIEKVQQKHTEALLKKMEENYERAKDEPLEINVICLEKHIHPNVEALFATKTGLARKLYYEKELQDEIDITEESAAEEIEEAWKALRFTQQKQFLLEATKMSKSSSSSSASSSASSSSLKKRKVIEDE